MGGFFMKYKSVFDIIGPVMVGPSSSHTAGSVRIGLTARNLFGEQPDKVDIYLYGSFRDTYRGHATDVALVGGVLGYNTDDSRIIHALDHAKEQGMTINIIEMMEERSHPNTALLHLFKGEEELMVEGISIGGGKIQLVSINDYPISISGNYHALLVFHVDEFGTIADVTAILKDQKVNIGNMNVSRKEVGQIALMTIELDGSIEKSTVDKINSTKGVKRVIELHGD